MNFMTDLYESIDNRWRWNGTRPTNLEWALQHLDYMSWRAQCKNENEIEPERFGKMLLPEETSKGFGKRMKAEDLVAVHLTKYFPENGTLRTLNTVFPEDYLRNTLHFAINHPVSDIACFGNWKDSKYAIVAPLEKLCESGENQVNNFNVVDTYFVGDVKIPTGATVLVSPFGREGAIQQGIVNSEKLVNFDCSRYPYPNESSDQLVIEKDKINYVFLSAGTDLREETYKEIVRRGYLCMGGGSWNWGQGHGADTSDQRRIADEIGAENIGAHSGGTMYGLESIGINILAGRGTEQGALDLLVRKPDFYDLSGSDKPINAFEYLENFKKEVPVECLPRIDRFMATNLERAKKQLSPEAIAEHDLAYLFE